MTDLKLELLLLCDYAILSKENKLSLLGIFDQIYVEKVPSQHLKMYLVGVLKGEPSSEVIIKFSIKDPQKNEILKTPELKIRFGENGLANLINEFGNFPIKEVGSYLIEVFTSDTKLGESKFVVLQVGGKNDGSETRGNSSN